MGAFVSRQPNGKLCRFSSIVDTVTDYNMTEDEYIEMCAEHAREEARDIIKNKLRPFQWVKDYFKPMEMSQEEFDKILKEMGDES